jgi:hypothetical protein
MRQRNKLLWGMVLIIWILAFLFAVTLDANAQGEGELAAPPIAWYYYGLSDCNNLHDIYSGIKQYCPGTVVFPDVDLKTRSGEVLSSVPYLAVVEVNWVDTENTRYSVVYCPEGLNLCVEPFVGFVDKKLILLDVDVIPLEER